MADHHEASVTLPSAPASVTTARGYVTDVLAEWGNAPERPMMPMRGPARENVSGTDLAGRVRTWESVRGASR